MKKVSNKKLKKKNNFNKIKIAIICIVIILLIITLLIIRLFKKETLTCTVSTSDVVSQRRIITLKLDNKKVKSIEERRLIDFDEQSNMYKSVLKSSLENAYNDLKISHEIKESKTSLQATSYYDKDNIYVIDNIDFDINDGSVAINMMDQDASSNSDSIDLKKSYSKSSIKKIFKKFNYLCE